MSEASDRALKDAEEAAKRWDAYVNSEFVEHVSFEAMHRGVTELMLIRGEMRALRIMLSELLSARSQTPS
ncbi:hypothetical protein U8607_11125 [Methylobacterium durans]|uniref:hypothetical protein n=1 Tax=Methylobacterium durans TaxID=2202825 RepID=UPI002AFE2353|nr:hypothetical protein [Methylobacterium durans]MEA1832632.1 hypothetical protein [Methylobacterium durans]